MKLIKLLTIAVSICGIGMFALRSEAQPEVTIDIKDKELMQRINREEKEAQKKSMQIMKLLEKAREARWNKKFKNARSYAESALRLGKDNREAQAFLSQLDEEERIYSEWKKRLTLEKEKKKREKEEVRERAKQEKELLKKERIKEEKKKVVSKREEITRERIEKEEAAREVKEEKIPEKELVEVKEKEKEEAAKKEEELIKEEELTPEELARRKERKRREERKKIEEEWQRKLEKKEVVPEEEKKAPKKEKGELAAHIKKGLPIIVDGDKVEYFEKENRIVAEGNVLITYGDVELNCERIEVDTVTRLAYCEKNVRIKQADKTTLTGDYIIYDFIKKRGEIISGEVSAYPWYGQAETSKRVGDNEFLLQDGYATTCDEIKPHYRLQAKRIKIFPDDKIIAKNVVWYIGKAPVFWFPYYYHPIIQSRAKVQFIPGRHHEWGNFLLSAWRIYMLGNTKMDAFIDYRDRKGFAEGLDLYYDSKDAWVPGLGHGLIRGYFIQQNGKRVRDLEKDDDNQKYRDYGYKEVSRRRIQWRHRLDFDEDTRGILEFNKLSDGSVIKDYFEKEYRENPSNQSYISFITSKENFMLSIEVNKRFHDYETMVQKWPEVKLTIPDQRLWKTPFYYGNTMSAASFNKVHERTMSGAEPSPYQRVRNSPPELANRFDTLHKLSYVTKLGPVRTVPYIIFDETLYDRTRWEMGLIDRASIASGVNTSTRIYRIFPIETDFLGLDINNLRHVIAPSAGYFHRHQPTLDKDSIWQMDGIDAFEKENYMTFSLENKLQTKRHFGEKLESVDLARLMVNTTYQFRLAKNNIEAKKEGLYRKYGRFQNFTFDFEFMPYKWLFADAEITVTPKNAAISTGSLEVTLNPVSSFQASMGYEYQKRMPKPRQDFTLDLTWKLNPKWQIGIYERVNWQAKVIEEQQFVITRDLHCWQVEVIYDVEGSRFFLDQYSVWVAFTIKAFPDMPIGLKQLFRKRIPGRLPPQQKPYERTS